MTEAAGEVADGLLVHPFHTPRFLEQITRPALARGFARGKRDPENFVISCQLIVATGSNEEELEAAKRGARTQIAFYASTPAYRPVLDCHERGELQRDLNLLSKRGDWAQMAERIDDELLEMIAVVALRDELPAKLSQRVANFAQRVSLIAPYGPDPVEWPEVLNALRQS